MKPCPFCAEDIQDAAVVCKHCGRDLNAVPAAPRATSARKALGARRPFVLAAVGAAVCGAVAAGAASGRVFAERPPPAAAAADTEASNAVPSGVAAAGGTEAVVPRRTPAPPEVPPEVLDLVDADAAEVGPAQWLHFGFSVGRDAPACRLRGRVLALTGGNRDVEVYVLSADDYLNWRNGGGTPPYTAAFSGPRQTATALDVELPAAGEYHLVVSNRFSVATAKNVQARARVVCAR